MVVQAPSNSYVPARAIELEPIRNPRSLVSRGLRIGFCLGSTMRILLVALLAVSLWAQDGTPVNISISPPPVGYTNLYFYNSADLQYACRAKSVQPTATFGISAATPFVLTSVVVLTNVGTVTTVSDNGLKVNDKVVFSGATVDTDLNGTYKIATVTSSKVFTIATASVANATYNEATLQFTTTAPRTSMPIWSIQKYTAVASQITASQWAVGTSGASQICDNRATLSYQ